MVEAAMFLACSVGCFAFVKSIFWRFKTGYQRSFYMGMIAFIVAIWGIACFAIAISSAMDVIG